MDKLFDLTGKVALIVGIGGIGHKLALGLAEYGADVVAADIKPDIAGKALMRYVLWVRNRWLLPWMSLVSNR